MTLYIILIVASLALLAITYFYSRARRHVAELQARYAPILDIDAEIARRTAEIGVRETTAAADITARFKAADVVRQAADEVLRRANQDKNTLAARYALAFAEYERLRSEVTLLEENVEDLSFGLYKPHFDFQSSEEFKRAIEEIRDRQRKLVRAGEAAVCGTAWIIGGSAKEGERMAKQNLKLVLRAFNAECDAAIANVNWSNAGRMLERLKKSFEELNKLGTVLNVSITEEYLDLRLDELRLTYEHESKRQQERDEQRRIREQIREEERVQRELAKAQEDAEKEEVRYEKALVKARQEAERVTGERLAALQGQIANLEASLEAAHQQKLRAQSRAQLTKSGYVYIISNPGSFGEQIYKVGMTRRLEPMERIAELGDASVPFPFDVHAMLYSDNAPELERSLHEHLTSHRVNLVNPRKEFFRAGLGQIETFARDRGILVEFTLIAEAREWRESVALRDQATNTEQVAPVRFGPSLFPEDAADFAIEA
jgi:hypothetical protein